ncbi:MFS transporter [Dongia sedimenti]|uniref:MFS transporter n=1 Tax=Dongia sedimenti TaxID=3064282 RepID=A0ABU0YPL3_9PROT|nr:MFS transporter [Rhodospirillaceae bacterium R-7]
MTTANAVGARLPSPRLIIPALGITQILAWGSSYYLPTVLAKPIVADTGWSLSWVVGGLSLGLLIAGLASPLVGRQIHRRGGRPVLAASAILLSLGLTILAASPNLIIFTAGWIVLGCGMSAGLYDAAFSTLGRLYGQAARQHITTLTLFGGLASTACWPLSAYLVTELGWRGACGVYAAIHLLICLPLYLFAVTDREAPSWAESGARKVPAEHGEAHPRSSAIFLLLAIAIMVGSMLSTVISVHILTILQAHGIALAAAVALGTIVGPSQVGARFVEMLVSRHHHPIWTKIVSVSCVALGLGLLWAGLPFIALTLVFYGAGIGLESIARATLPLALFGPADYAPIMGRLARPSLIAQAAAPSIGAFLIQWLGAESALGIIVAVAAANVALSIVLLILVKTDRSARPPKSMHVTTQ